MATIRPTGYLAHYGISEEDYLEHYGVKGMKWGKHLKAKIQNSLTDRHYYKRLAEGHEADAAREHARSNAENEQYKGAKRSQAEFEKRAKFYEQEGAKAQNRAASSKLNEKYINRIKDPDKKFDAQYDNALEGITATSYKEYVSQPGVKYNEDRAWDSWNAARHAKSRSEAHKTTAEHAKKSAKSYRNKYDQTVPGKVEKAYKKGKAKIKNLLGKMKK